MSPEPPDRFAEEILSRLDGVEETPRIDRDGRHGIIAVVVIAAIVLSMVTFRVVLNRPSEATAGGLEAGLPLVSPGTILEAVDRIKVPSEEINPEEPSESEETQAIPGRYEAIDATAPGRRT